MLRRKENKLANIIAKVSKERQHEIMQEMTVEIAATEALRTQMFSFLNLTITKTGLVIELDQQALQAVMESAGISNPTPIKKKLEPMIVFIGKH